MNLTNIIKLFLLVVLSMNLYATDEQEIQELKKQVGIILKRIEALEKRANLKAENKVDKVLVKNVQVDGKEKSKPKMAQYITDDVLGQNPPVKQKGTIELTTADTVLSFGGRIQLDIDSAWPEGTHSARGIPVTNTPGENGQLLMSARDSRLWFKTRTPSAYGPIRTLIETDFVGSDGTETNTNSSHMRIRHAYVQVSNWTVGQTNSAFNTHVTLDNLQTAINDVFVRQPLIRYSREKDLYSYDISFEQPETTLIDSDGNIITPKDDVVPDVIGRIRYYPSWGELGFSLMGRYINQDHAELSDGTKLNNRDATVAWATNVSGKIKVNGGQDDIRFAAHYGKGMGRYIAYNAYAAGSIDADGNIKLQPSFGAHLGYRHWWNSKLRSTVSISYVGTKNNMDVIASAAARTLANKEASSSQVNLIWTPIPNSLVGLEYAKSKRKVESGAQGDIDLLRARFRYDF